MLRIPSKVTAGQVLCLCKRLVEVGDDVAGILATDGEAKETGRDAGRDQLLRGVLAVARRGRMVHHRIDAAEARRSPAELEGVHEPLAGLPAAFELEGEHPAGVGELAKGEIVLRVALEPGVQHPRECGSPH